MQGLTDVMPTTGIARIGNIYNFTGGSFDGNVYHAGGIISSIITFPGGGVPRITEIDED